MTVIPGTPGESWLASGDVDGVIRLWDPVGARMRIMTSGSGSAINALIGVPGIDGQSWLASADVDGVIRIWDPAAGQEIRSIDKTGTAIYALAMTQGPDAPPSLVSADADGVIRIWDPLSGREWQAVQDRQVMLWDITLVPKKDGTPLLAAAGVDGKIRLRDTADWNRVLAEFSHPGVVYALAVLPDSAGNSVASAGVNGEILVWPTDSDTEPVKFAGHSGPIRDLIVLPNPAGGVWIASAGGDGAVRLWDPKTAAAGAMLDVQSGSVLSLAQLALSATPAEATTRTSLISGLSSPTEAGEILTVGFGDSFAKTDLLGRGSFVDVVVELLHGRPDDFDESDSGPTVISVEGPWGSGKSTLMALVKTELDEIYERSVGSESGSGQPGWAAKSGRHRFPFTVCVADWIMRRMNPVMPKPAAEHDLGSGAIPITVWFNPWAYQSLEQVWAGLAREIISSSCGALYPEANQAERYWFAKNVKRLDRRAIRRQLWRRILSPLLGLTFLGVLIPILAVFVASEFTARPPSVHVLGHSVRAGEVALLLPSLIIVIGLLHTLLRYAFGRASLFLPVELFRGPLMSNSSATSDRPTVTAADDPLYNAASGYLYLLQHDIRDLLEDVQAAGYQLTIFIDDLDRCSPHISAEVFEAINLFLSESFPRARFVIGLDPVVVAANIDHSYKQFIGSKVATADDPTPGWTFLRKLIQLPVVLPRVRTDGIDRLLDSKLGPPHTIPDDGSAGTPADRSSAVGIQTGPHRSVVADGTSASMVPEAVMPTATAAVERAVALASDDSADRANGHAQLNEPSEGHGSAPHADLTGSTDSRAQALADSPLALERDPTIRTELRLRLAAQPDQSVRQAKRLITVWQFYVRLCARLRPVSGQEAITRACQLILVSEIVTRWPAILRDLARPVEGITAVQLLALAPDDNAGWMRTVREAGLQQRSSRELDGLRDLLSDRNGPAAADLFTWLI